MSYKRFPTSVLILAGASMLFTSGCMLMHGGMGHGSNHGNQSSMKVVIKEIQKDNFSVTLEVPALMASAESALTVKVKNIATGNPVSGARVSLVIVPNREQQDAELVIPPTGEEGLFEISRRFTQPGSHEITAKVVVNSEDDQPIIVSVTQDVVQHTDHKSRRFSKPLMILGGIGMGLMMVLMFL